MKKEVNERIEFCKMAIVEAASKVKQEQNIQGKCTKKGFLTKLIQEKKKEFGLGDDTIISPKTIYNCLYCNLTGKVKMGPKSPLHELEDLLVNVLIKMSQCCRPLTRSKGLALASSMIQGTHYQEKVIKFQTKNCKGTMKKETKKVVGMAYWQNFLK